MPGAIQTPFRLEDLVADVLITSVSSGQVLEWNGSAWVNATPSSGGTPGGGSGQIQYDASGSFGGIAGSGVGTGGQITLTSQGATYTPLTLVEASGQTAPLLQMESTGGLPTFQLVYGQGIYLGYNSNNVVYSGAPGTSNVNAQYGGNCLLASTGMFAWAQAYVGGGNDIALVRNAANNLGVTNASSTTYATIGSNGLFLAEKASAPSTPSGGGILYVDSSGNLWYLSPGGTSTKLASD